MDDEDVLSQVMLDEVFFRESGGGMTLSGGEPLAQADFSALLMRRTKERGIHNCVETAGFAPRSELEKLIPYTDLFLYDIKLIDRSRHMYWTGVPNEIIMGNLIAICDAGREAIVRTPLIPGVNDGDEFVKIVDYVAGLAHVAEFHILPFHQLGASKYGHMGWEYEMSEVEEIGDEVVERAREYAESQGLRVSVGGYGFRFREEMR
jgi:pyruvate formate lyase activating enzyme